MFLRRRLIVEALKIYGRPRRLTRKVVKVREGGREEEEREDRMETGSEGADW
jgi:hypothetical protein